MPWPEEAFEIVSDGRALTELNAVGPWVAERIQTWLADPPPVAEPDEARRGFLTYAEVRRTLDGDPAWEATPHADLQMHTTWSDGSLPLEEMVEAARALGRSFVAITDHSQALAIAHGMSPERLAAYAPSETERIRLVLPEGDGAYYRKLDEAAARPRLLTSERDAEATAFVLRLLGDRFESFSELHR